MKIQIVTLFKDMVDSVINESILKRANDKALVSIEAVDFRTYSKSKHKHVDDTPYGGDRGMVLKVEPIYDCLENLKTENCKVIMMSPQGIPLTQELSYELAAEDHLIMLCGHYEGFDERIRNYVDLEVSIGDYVLTGGEMAALVVTDSVVRLVDGVIKEESHQTDSFATGLLSYPQYTRPREFMGDAVPDVLTSGHHKNIKRWQLKESLRRTKERRPDLLDKRDLSKLETELLLEIDKESK